MDIRSLARGLRARPTPWLLSPRQQPQITQPILPSTLRYNSSDSSSKNPPTQTATAEEPAPKEHIHGKRPVSDFDEILNKLDFGNRNQPDYQQPRPGSGRSTDASRRVFSDNISRTVTGGVGSQAWREQAAQLSNRKTELKLGPTLGRQVHVEPERNLDLPAALRQLHGIVQSNRIKAMSIQQKYHVRRGAMRKQLRRDRWRKLFKFSFQETVKRIQRMQSQGW